MASLLSKAILGAGCVVLANGAADAQTVLGRSPYNPVEQTPLPVTTPQVAYHQRLSEADAANLRAVLEAAKTADAQRMRTGMMSIENPLGRKIALWALADSNPDALTFFEADAARRDLTGWPRPGKRQETAEKKLETSGLDPARIIAWFGGAEPETAEGAMALASAYRMTGRQTDAANLIRRFWRDKSFEADQQRTMLARFSDLLTTDDHVRRADVLLYGAQGPATKDMVAVLPEPHRTLGEIRMGLRAGSSAANDRLTTLAQEQLHHPGIVFEKATYLRKRGMDIIALQMARSFPPPQTEEAASRIWGERKQLIATALKNGDHRGAYAAAANTGMTVGPDAAEAEFYAGWLALNRLKKPQLAGKHFAAVAAAGTSPITQGRALYWQGRAAEAAGDPVGAQVYYGEGAKHLTVFYGQLAAEKAGIKKLELGKDPLITQADRARFDGREPVRAAKMLAEIGARDQFRAFILHIDDTLPTVQEHALLVDMARLYGDQDLGMRAVRTAAQRGFILPERGYPLRSTPAIQGGAEPAFVLSITRQESNFDPYARSSVGARGMMQLMPATAQIVARRLGEPYSAERLHDADFNMRLGSSYLGGLVEQFSGSYIMAAAGYNAGPGRPTSWTAHCGDPRGASTDAVDFIECIPFSETRNYVMRTLETTQVYRARMAGGSAPLMLSADLNRGSYGYYAANTPPPITGTQP